MRGLLLVLGLGATVGANDSFSPEAPDQNRRNLQIACMLIEGAHEAHSKKDPQLIATYLREALDHLAVIKEPQRYDISIVCQDIGLLSSDSGHASLLFESSDLGLNALNRVDPNFESLARRLLQQRAFALLQSGCTELAIQCLYSARDIAESTGECDPEAVVEIGETLSLSYSIQGDVESAQSELRNSIETLRRRGNADVQLAARLESGLGVLYLKMNEPIKARECLERAIGECWSNEEVPDWAVEAIFFLAKSYSRTWEYAKSIEWLSRGLELAVQRFGAKDIVCVNMALDLARQLYDCGEIANATAALRKVEMVKPNDSRASPRRIATILVAAGDLWVDLGNIELGREYIEGAQSVISGLPAAGELRLNLFSAMGRLYAELGNWVRAEDCFRIALECADVSEPNYQVLAVLHNYAHVSLRQNDLVRASMFARRAYEMAVSLYGINHAMLAEEYALEADIAYCDNQLSESIKYSLDAIDCFESSEARMSGRILAERARIALARVALGDYVRAAQELTDSLAQCDDGDLRYSEDWLCNVLLIGFCLGEEGYARESLEILRTVMGSVPRTAGYNRLESAYVALSCGRLSRFSGRTSDRRAGASLFVESLESDGTWNGVKVRSADFRDVAFMCRDALGWERGGLLVVDLATDVLSEIAAAGAELSEESRRKRVANILKCIGVMVCGNTGGGSLSEVSRRVVLLYELAGEVFWNSKEGFGSRVGEARGEVAAGNVESFMRAQGMVSRVASSRGSSSAIRFHGRAWLERYLYSRWLLAPVLSENSKTTIASDRRRTENREGSVTVLFDVVEPLNECLGVDGRTLRGLDRGMPRLCVWVVDCGDESVEFLDLGEVNSVVSSWKEYVESIGEKQWRPEDCKEWRPLLDAIEDKGKLYVVHNSIREMPPIEVLRYADGRYVCEVQEVLYVEHPQHSGGVREVHCDEIESALVVGSLRYEDRSWLGSWNRLSNGQWPSLQWSGAEIDCAMEAMSGRMQDDRIRVLCGDQAQERDVKTMLPCFDWIHLSTHGAFILEGLDEIHAADCASGSGSGVCGCTTLMREVPGVRSSLVLSGLRVSDVEEAEDNYLTAEEVAWLDLRRSKCVVLASCRGSVGAEMPGGGMLGMSRAFVLAGAGNVLSSIWDVGDSKMSEFIGRFYENVWGRGMQVCCAVRSAKLETLNRSRDAGQEDGSPLAWGGYILTVK